MEGHSSAGHSTGTPPKPAGNVTKAPPKSAGNSTENLLKLFASSMSGTTKKTKAKTSGKKLRRSFSVGRANTTPPAAVNRFTSGSGLSEGKYDAKDLGTNFVVGNVSTPLADAPSVGASVNARLKRLHHTVESKVFKKDTGSIKVRLQDIGEYGVNKRVRTYRQPGAFEREVENLAQAGPGKQTSISPATSLKKKNYSNPTQKMSH